MNAFYAVFAGNARRPKGRVRDLEHGHLAPTRSRVNAFMKKIKKLGLIEHDGELKGHGALVNIALHDRGASLTQASDELTGR